MPPPGQLLPMGQEPAPENDVDLSQSSNTQDMEITNEATTTSQPENRINEYRDIISKYDAHPRHIREKDDEDDEENALESALSQYPDKEREHLMRLFEKPL